MMLFTFLSLIVLLVIVCMQIRKKELIPIVFSGVISALLVCAFRIFFLFAHRVVPYSFSENFAFLLFQQALLPIILLYGLFFLISRDSLEFKVEMFLPLTASFYMIYLPFCIISSAEGLYSAFGLFVKPCLFIAMLYFLSFAAKAVMSTAKNKKFVFMILFLLLSVLYLFVPALIESMYLMTTNLFIAILCSIPYCLLPFLLFFFSKIKM